jgi:hypothetical protein
MNKIIEIKNEILAKTMEKKNVYYEISSMFTRKGEEDFDNDLYESKIREYLSMNEVEKLEKKLQEIEGYNIISDQFYSSGKKNEIIGKIDYIIKSSEKNKKKKKIIKKKEKK